MRIYILLIAVSANTATASSNKNFEIYAESAYVSRQSVFSHVQQIRWDEIFFKPIRYYLQAGSELQMPSYMHAESQSHGYVYGGVGIKVTYKLLSFYQEARFKKFYLHLTKKKPTTDKRSLVTISDEWNWSWKATSRYYTFDEFYSETLYSSDNDKNIIQASYNRLGIGLKSGNLFTDAFIEPFFTIDRHKNSYNNLVELRASIRGRYSLAPYQLALTLAKTYTQPLARGAKNLSTPLRGAWGQRLLLVVGGMF